jgi:hypothetical protein
MSLISDLARAQLDAYNRADLDAFCACYHPEIRVLDEHGECTLEGIEAFRVRYGGMFERFEQVQASVPHRVGQGRHCVDLEHYSRVERSSQERSGGTVLVRYTERDGLIACAQFFG